VNSIRINLLKWLLGPILVMNLIGAGLTYWLAWVPARVAFDQSLADSAWALITRLRLAGSEVEVDLPRQAEQILRVDHFDAIYFVVRNASGHTVAGDQDFPALQVPLHADDPLAYDAVMRGEPVRVISLRTTLGAEEVLIGAAETLRKRRQSRSEILVGLLALESALTLVLIVIVWAAVGRGLRPLRRMQAELNRRAHDELSPVGQKDSPVELMPVVQAINGLLDRVRAGAEAQQDFLADVAHQLRTPLAGLRTHLEWMRERYTADREAARSIELMLSATDRMTRKTNQLLALARAEPSHYKRESLEPVQLEKVVEESIQHFVQEADKKQIDLGFELHPTLILGDRFLLRDLIDNLIDNAIRYTPQSGRVTVTTMDDADHGVLIVEDNGPGIPQHARELVFSRFYRLDHTSGGSGIGLAIVRDIVEDLGARIAIEAGSNGAGTAFAVYFRRPQ
jgi:two-component system sensor histidine kinase TctE